MPAARVNTDDRLISPPRSAKYYDKAMRKYVETRRHNLASRVASLANGPRIVELGCGTGLVTHHLAITHPGAHIIAMDFAPFCVQATAKRVPQAEVYLQDVCLLSELGALDSVVAVELLEHVECDLEVVRWAMMSAPRLVASVPKGRAIKDLERQHVRIYTAEMIRRRFGALGTVTFHKHKRTNVWLLFTLDREGGADG